MSKRAKYDGPFSEVEIQLPNDRFIVVEKGRLLPEEDGAGDSIPASFRDALLEQDGNWTEVKQSSGSPSSQSAKEE